MSRMSLWMLRVLPVERKQRQLSHLDKKISTSKVHSIITFDRREWLLSIVGVVTGFAIEYGSVSYGEQRKWWQTASSWGTDVDRHRKASPGVITPMIRSKFIG